MGSLTPPKAPQTATHWSVRQYTALRYKTQHTWYHSIDRKLIFVHVKFEYGSFILFTRELTPNKK